MTALRVCPNCFGFLRGTQEAAACLKDLEGADRMGHHYQFSNRRVAQRSLDHSAHGMGGVAIQSRRQRMARNGTACWWGRSHGQLFPSGALQGRSLFDVSRKQKCSWIGPSVSEAVCSFSAPFSWTPAVLVDSSTEASRNLTLYLLEGSFIGPLVNPICWATQQSEDFVGRPSRLARRVTPKLLQVAPRVLQRHLQASYEHFAKAGYIIRPTSKAFDGWEGSLKLPRLSNFEPCQFLTWQTSKGGCYKVFTPFWIVFQAPYIHFRPGTLWQSTSHWAPSGKMHQQEAWKHA